MSTSGKKKNKKRPLLRILPRWLSIFLPLLILLIVLVAVGLPLLPRFGIELKLPFTRHTRISESEILLTRVRPLLKLTTVEYTYKSVFPYDFIPPGVDIARAYRRAIQGEPLSTEEQEAAELYRLCVDTGIRVWSQDYAFVVITTGVKGGYDLKQDQWPGTDPADPPVQTNPALKTVSIRLPRARITEFILRDETSDLYRFPDIEVDAEEWKMISEYVANHLRKRVIDEGILEHTEQNMRELITTILKQNGWEKITFRS